MTLRGTVVEFDATVGLGVVRGDDGADYRFHCVEIADGSRDIAVGTAVRFGPLAKLGTVEAAAVTPA